MKKFLSIVLSILMVMTMIPLAVMPVGAAAAADITVTIDTGASVTLKDADSDGYYDIGTANDLYAFAAAVNGGNSEINGELTADITVNKNVLTADGALNGNGSNFRVWTPIGGNSYTYNGTFDGGEHTVSGLYFNNSTVNSVGMFGNIYNGGKVMNVGVIDSYICGSGYVGGLAGSINDGTVENSYNTGTVTGRTDVGGLVGDLDGTITNSYNAGTVTGTSSHVGGVVGSNGYYFGTITNCYNTGSVSSTGSYVGGVVGNNYNTVTNSYNTGSVSGSAHVGGVVGSNNASAKNVANCYNIGTVSGTDNFVGAVAGGNFSTVTNCYYLNGCATGANNVKQFGIGNGNAGSTTADVSGSTTGKNSSDFGNGSVCELVGYHSIDENCVCTICGAVEHNNFDIKGFCTECDAYEPAELNENGYYEIGNAGQLFWFANYINTVDRTANAVLTADIDLENRPWTPIGSTGENNNNFRGVFDGQNHTIEGLYVEGGRAGLGFFGEVRTGTVKNFTIYGEVVANTEVDYIGGVIGSVCGLNGENDLARNGAVIQNITSYVNLTAKKHGIGMIGGFVGYANHQSLIENCSWYGTFDAGIYRVDSGAGGFIGKIQENTSEVTIRNCGAYGTIKTNYAGDYNDTATIYMGGFLSFTNTNAKTTLENCLFAGKFERGDNLTDEAFLGAFGTVRSVNAIKNCYYLGDDGLEAVHSDSNLKPGSDNVEIIKVTAEQLKSGEIAYKLGDAWGQTIGTDNYPVLGGEKVYYGYVSCADDTVAVYSNSSNASATKPAHDWSDKNGICANGCGAECTHENQTGSVCEICGISLHTCDFTGEWKYDADKHWKECTDASCDKISEGIAHTGGTATCTTQAVCTTCGAQYGDFSKTNHTFDNTCCGYYGAEGNEQSVWWTLVDGTLTIGGTGAMADKHYTHAPWYNSARSITALVVQEGVTHIGENSFRFCGFMNSVNIPASVETIGSSAFMNCSYMKEVTFAAGSRVTELGDSVFQNTGLEQITIPASVTSIGDLAFDLDLSLTDIFIEEGNTSYKDIDGVLYTTDGTLVLYPINKAETEFTTPEGVTKIAAYAFCNNKNLVTITLSEGVTTIEEAALANCESLQTLTIPASVTAIAEWSLDSYYNLVTVNVPCNWDGSLYTFMDEYVTLNYSDHVADETAGQTCKGYKCTACGAFYGEVAADAHDWSNKDGICANGCGAECTHENQTGNVCEICGAELHVCDFTGEWKYDADKHWKECTAEYCIKISEEAEHSYVNGKCSCGYACPHDSYTDGVCDNCDYECAHAWGEGALTRPVYDAVLGSKDGYYTYTCTVCGEEKTETVKSADYSAYEAVSAEINALLQSDELTDAAKQAIYSAANECGLPSNDLTESEQNKVDDLVAELEKIVADAEEKIASGEYVKINGLEEIVKIKDKLNEDLTEKYGEEALAEITDKIGYKYDEKFDELYEKAEALTGSVAENKEALEEIEAEMEAIFAELEKCLAGTHSFTDYEIVRYADCVNNALEMGSCSVCGETDEREIPDSASGHKPAWWWETTETEHYKHCINDSCADEIEGTRGQHVYENYEITKAAACGANAEETGTCICGMTHTREVEGTALTHSFTKYEVTEEAECGKAGKEVAYCDHGCGATDEKKIPALTHKDDNGDYKCDYGCGHEFEKPVEPDQPDDPSEKCDHLCHKDGILGFLWKIISFFCRLFNIQQYCDCGVIHYDAPVFG